MRCRLKRKIKEWKRKYLETVGRRGQRKYRWKKLGEQLSRQLIKKTVWVFRKFPYLLLQIIVFLTFHWHFYLACDFILETLETVESPLAFSSKERNFLDFASLDLKLDHKTTAESWGETRKSNVLEFLEYSTGPFPPYLHSDGTNSFV